MHALPPHTPQSDDSPFALYELARIDAAITELFRHFSEITPARLALQAACSREVAHAALVRLVLTGRAILLCGDRVGPPQVPDTLLDWEAGG
jgi:hypothetical protein